MTIVDVMDIVRDETGKDVIPETELNALGLDSLEFLELMVRLDIPDAAVPHMNTVADLWAAADKRWPQKWTVVQ